MSRRDPKAICEHCAFWDPHWRVTGFCRREAPKVFQSDDGGDTVWPTTSNDQWCGEFSPHYTTPQED